jgi:threonine aldolase
MWGGGMRQVGVLAAAAEHAVDNHFGLLEEDHFRAKEFAKFLQNFKDLSINPDKINTNIVLFDVNNKSVDSVLKQLRDHGVGMSPFGPETIRAVFHFQITDADLEMVKTVFSKNFN